MSLFPGEFVEVKYIDIDEIEVTCKIIDHDRVGYLDNSKMKIKPEEIQQKDVLRIAYIDADYIKLSRL